MSLVCTPADLLASAKCFNCLTTKQLRAIRAYLLSQFVPCVPGSGVGGGGGGGGTPIVGCNAPLAVTSLEVTSSANNPGPTTITIDWTQPLGIPPVTTTGYAVLWGTSPGVYNAGLAFLVGSPSSYTITGLTPSTTYYIAVIALHGLCPSPTTTLTALTAAMSNGLLSNLISHWAFENAVGTDDKDGNTLSETAGVTHPAGGIIGNYCRVNGVGVGTYLLNCPANLQAGPGVSFTFQIWAQYFADTVPIAANAFASATQVWRLYTGVRNIHWLCYDSGGGASDWDTLQVLPLVGWHQIVCGFDAVANNQFLQFDNGPRLTNPMASNLRASNGIFVLGADGSAITDNVGIDEAAYWTGVLTTAQVSALYNGGAGLPFSSYQP